MNYLSMQQYTFNTVQTTTNILYGFVYLSARVGQQVQF